MLPAKPDHHAVTQWIALEQTNNSRSETDSSTLTIWPLKSPNLSLYMSLKKREKQIFKLSLKICLMISVNVEDFLGCMSSCCFQHAGLHSRPWHMTAAAALPGTTGLTSVWLNEVRETEREGQCSSGHLRVCVHREHTLTMICHCFVKRLPHRFHMQNCQTHQKSSISQKKSLIMVFPKI